MAITPISTYMPMRSKGVSFSSRNKNSEQLVPEELHPQSSKTLSGLKKVPVIVMLAMSPITVPNAEASTIGKPEAQPAETSQYYSRPQKREPELIGEFESIRGIIPVRERTYECFFGKFDLDGNKKDCEMLTFIYKQFFKKLNATGLMYGAVIKLSSEPVNKNGDYAMAFARTCKDGKTRTFITLVPKEFAKKIESINFTDMGIKMRLIGHINDMRREFGEPSGYISDYVNMKVNGDKEEFLY